MNGKPIRPVGFIRSIRSLHLLPDTLYKCSLVVFFYCFLKLKKRSTLRTVQNTIPIHLRQIDWLFLYRIWNNCVVIDGVCWQAACVADILVATPNRLIFLLQQSPPALSLTRYNGETWKTISFMLYPGINLYSTIILFIYIIQYSKKYNCYAGVFLTRTLFCTLVYSSKCNVTFIKLGTKNINVTILWRYCFTHYNIFGFF